MAKHDVANSVRAGKVDQSFHGLLRLETDHFSSKIARPLLIIEQVSLHFRVNAVRSFLFALNMNGIPISIQPAGKPGALFQENCSMGRRVCGKAFRSGGRLGTRKVG